MKKILLDSKIECKVSQFGVIFQVSGFRLDDGLA